MFIEMSTKFRHSTTSYSGNRTPSRGWRAAFGLLALATVAYHGSVSAQAVGRVVGRITEESGAPVAGAQVVLDGGQYGTLTNDVGSFALSNVSPGRHALRVERIGFATHDAQVDVVAGATATIDIQLETEVLALDGLIVIGSREEMEITRRQLREVPGGVTLLTPAALRQTRQANFGDVMRFTAGVFAQPRFGAADETQFSIRGSGLRNNFHLRGVNILVNSMPYRLADGFTDFETLEMLNTESVQVYKGANALRFGGSTLGGAVNFESKTGHTARPIEAYAQ